jgi:hypothetical protein
MSAAPANCRRATSRRSARSWARRRQHLHCQRQVVFTSRKSEAAIKTALEKGLQAYAGKPVGVLVRSAAEMAQVLSDNPFPNAAPSRIMALFLDRAPPADTLAGIRGQRDEQIQMGRREIYGGGAGKDGSGDLTQSCSPNGAKRNSGPRQGSPDCASLHPGYDSLE